MALTAQEQYLIELINRARLDPAGEAARQGVGLNDGLPYNGFGTVSAAPMQVLAPSAELDRSATGHADWMAATGNFSHIGASGSDHTARITSAGYDFAGAWHLGENLALVPYGSSVTEALMARHHDTLFNSPAHRSNMFQRDYREIGLAEAHNSSQSFLTENFGYQSQRIYVTGVAYSDRDADNFYSVGEAVGNLRIAVTGGTVVHTSAAGGYGLVAAQVSALAVEVGSGASLSRVKLNLSFGNVKLDVVDGDTLMTSGNMTLVSGIAKAGLLGIGNLSLTGNGASNVLTGNVGANRLSGAAGNDKIIAGSGNDTISGDAGSDALNGANGADLMRGGDGIDTISGGSGADRLYGNTRADFLYGGSENDRLDGGAGNDALNGGTGADVFVFNNNSGADRVLDLSFAQQDRLALDNALWGNVSLSTAQIVARYAHVTASGVVFDLPDTDSLTVTNLHSLTGLAAAIDII